ncbi:hypothetical protein [Henriciella pelagia]
METVFSTFVAATGVFVLVIAGERVRAFISARLPKKERKPKRSGPDYWS